LKASCGRPARNAPLRCGRNGIQDRSEPCEARAVRSHHVPKVNAKTLGPILEAQLHGASYVYTDEGGAMRKAGSQFEHHDSINHSIGEYVRGPVHTNTIEGYFSIMKRGIHASITV
jgi:hypothetical protein